MNTIDKQKFPIGMMDFPGKISEEYIMDCIKTIEEFPERLESIITTLTEQQLDTPYRKGGWTIRQVVHHCADSHQNSYTRFKWALTEDKPLIKVYLQDKWAELDDSKYGPVELSLNLLKALHTKWVYLLKRLSKEDLKKVFIHPDGNEEITLEENICIYAWHCKHHFAHIVNLVNSFDID